MSGRSEPCLFKTSIPRRRPGALPSTSALADEVTQLTWWHRAPGQSVHWFRNSLRCTSSCCTAMLAAVSWFELKICWALRMEVMFGGCVDSLRSRPESSHPARCPKRHGQSFPVAVPVRILRFSRAYEATVGCEAIVAPIRSDRQYERLTWVSAAHRHEVGEQAGTAGRLVSPLFLRPVLCDWRMSSRTTFRTHGNAISLSSHCAAPSVYC